MKPAKTKETRCATCGSTQDNHKLKLKKAEEENEHWLLKSPSATLRVLVPENTRLRARVEMLEKALREIAIRTGQWEARAIDCQEIAAVALKAKP